MPYRLIGVAEDITTRRQTEEALRQSQAELLQAQKMEAVGRLAGGVAHDFNNILAVIVMYGSLLRERAAGDATEQGYLDQILKSAERAANLTRSLLTFSRKRVEAELRALDLNEVVQGIAKLLLRVLGEQVEVRTHLRGQELVVRGDAGQLEQVVMNLGTNARDAMPEGGVLTIETAIQEIDPEFVAAHGFGRIGRYAVLTVTDTGTGMDEQTRRRIFEPFFTTKEVGRGTGLGLAIVYGIVKQHDGFISVYSQVGQGTAFRIYLPLVTRAATAPEPPGAAAVPGGSELVLLAEDEEEVRRITRAILEEHGYRVLEAADGEEAVRVFRAAEERIDLFLSDVIMPRMNGREALAEMRRSDPGLRVLFTSGYTADVLEQKGILAAPGELVSKPASPTDLLRRVRELLDRA
jgi:nitrogen-specific signal transduction histidine kinase